MNLADIRKLLNATGQNGPFGTSSVKQNNLLNILGLGVNYLA